MAFVVQLERDDGRIQFLEDIYGTVDDLNEGVRTFKTMRAAEASAKRFKGRAGFKKAVVREVNITMYSDSER